MEFHCWVSSQYRSQIAKRTERMLYLLWLLGHAIPMNRVYSMVSCAVEQGFAKSSLMASRKEDSI